MYQIFFNSLDFFKSVFFANNVHATFLNIVLGFELCQKWS